VSGTIVARAAPWRGAAAAGRLGLALLCALASGPAAQAETDDEALARLTREMEALVAGAACGSPTFCLAVAMGSDACGNPTRWLPYHRGLQVADVLQTKAAEYTFIEEDRWRGKPRPVDCKPARPPRLACVNGRCVLGDTSY
jgi:hypothetical protein